MEEDEQLARAIQESLNIESPPQHGNGNGNGNIYQPIPFPYSTGFRYKSFFMLPTYYYLIYNMILFHHSLDSFVYFHHTCLG